MKINVTLCNYLATSYPHQFPTKVHVDKWNIFICPSMNKIHLCHLQLTYNYFVTFYPCQFLVQMPMDKLPTCMGFHSSIDK